jgi:hypothetical protein
MKGWKIDVAFVFVVLLLSLLAMYKMHSSVQLVEGSKEAVAAPPVEQPFERPVRSKDPTTSGKKVR